MSKLFSAEYIENVCSLWEFGGSWILNSCERVLSYHIGFPFPFLVCYQPHAVPWSFWSLSSEAIQREGVRCCEGPSEVWGWKPATIKACRSPNKYQNRQLCATPLQMWVMPAEEQTPLSLFPSLRVVCITTCCHHLSRLKRGMGTVLVILHPELPGGQYCNQRKLPFHYLYSLFYMAILQTVNHHFTRFGLCLEHINLCCL